MQEGSEILENIDGQKIHVWHRIFTISNVISLSRAIVAVPIIWLHFKAGEQTTWLVNVLIVYCIASDYLDGYIARKTDNVSELGKALDPLADKICALILFGYTVMIGWIPVWFLLTIIGRDLLIGSGALFIRYRKGKVPMAAMSGKVSLNAVAVYWLSVFYFPDFKALHTWLLVITMVILIYSFGEYIYRYTRIMQGAEFN